ncbi:MAG: MHS family MFS transporter [Phenylobacterium sp.]|jgi:predicted MFS family arabinose efflux permease|uniref:MFS transporter n=1 Tax=Phenylobacterium sp. TaxID=1871053 RepID=UPI0025D62270|nr:MFS transporter [Phenylobacterium sp.]MCA3708460.1 MHS family MFS transporter [Phenylobacterium sp.]MCA3728155.1 MHS family MFS transporter [Phenylobacterium sp.]MCA3751740.1 MHS family MFS transporter [Phenylobacterium sp.]MCA4917511.1 MHS family MFS transporter [Phenylobacterium sp.]MCA6245887.1 MHS family MFS transporter [Phenylobacterium sp.]
MAEKTRNDRMIVGAASAGTVFEWYDFYLYGSLTAFISLHFFSGVNETTGFILALMAFAAGFAVRPFGALVFGRLGDLWGRKNTFLVTMLLMGLSTFAVGLLPDYSQIGVAAPIILVFLRLLQGLALGGEYGGAATYVAEHAPDGKRGLYTSWIQTTATLGLFLSLVVIILVRTQVGEEAFKAWGWRIPFLVSAVLLVLSMWIRLKLNESPVFQKMVDEGTTSKKPLAEAFADRANLKLVVLALVGLTAGQAVVWYTGQFYSLFFLEKTLKVDGLTTNALVATALLIGTPFFIVFGWLSDKIGRKPIILAGCLLAVLTYFPIFKALTVAANPALAAASASAPVTVIADPAECAFQFDPIGRSAFASSCDIAKSALASAGVSYRNEAAPAGTLARVRIGQAEIAGIDGRALSRKDLADARAAWSKTLGAALSEAGYPAKADPARINKPLVVGLLTLLVLYVTMVYGPIAAALVEMFPARIRYTSMSLPYHIGNGWFGGFLPATAFAMVAASGDIYRGLWYPIVVAGVTLIVGGWLVREMRGAPMD